MTEVRLYGRRIDKSRLEVGVAMDNLTDEVAFLFDPAENPYIADESSTAFLKTDTLHVPCKLPMTVERTANEVCAFLAFTSGMIPFEGCFTGQIQIEVANPQGGFFVWQSLPFELIVAQTIDADKAVDSQLAGAYDQLFAFEQAEATRVEAEQERQQNEESRIATMEQLQGSLTNTIELIERIESTLEADQLGIGIASAAVNTDTGHLLVTLTSGRVLDAGYVVGPKGDKGDDGDEVELAVQNGYVVWKYTDETTYRQLIALADLEGTDGQEVELQVTSDAIQWRLGSGAWLHLISLDSLKRQDGADGTSFIIKGMYSTLEELTAAHATGSAGDAYAVGSAESNTTYLWDIDQQAWVDVGSIKGDKGDSLTFDSLSQAQKDALCKFTDANKEKVDQLCERVDQDVTTSGSPSFISVTAQIVQADKVIGAVYA
ncbi:MAG: hypothetical protein IJZ74_05615 [Clostridia bacterium]|nr:hypothetical protein [Clostridia bacterium]